MTIQDALCEIWELKSATNQKIDNLRKLGEKEALLVQQGYLSAILKIEKFLEQVDEQKS